MKRLLTFLFAATIIISCQNTGSDSVEPNLIQIGTWSVNTDEMTGTWTGSDTKSKTIATTQAEGDTLFFDEPDGNGLEIWSVSESNEGTKLNVTYVDSAFNSLVFDTTEASADITVDGPFWDSGSPLFWGSGIEEDRWSASTSIPFSCDSTYNFNNEYIEVTMLDDNEEFFKAFHFNTQGIVESARFLACGDTTVSS